MPPSYIRPDGEMPSTQDSIQEEHLSDFEDLLDGSIAPASASNPSPHPNDHSSTTTKPPLPLPSTAAHTLPLLTVALASNSQPKDSAPSPLQPAPINPRISRLLSQISGLQSQLSTLRAELSASNAKLSDPSRADSIVKAHIRLLHDYNEIKDVGLGLMGMIADGRGVMGGEVMEEFGVCAKD